MPSLPRIDRDNLEAWGFKPNTKQINGQMAYMMDDNHWGPYQKRYATFARQMDGPFEVLIDKQWVHCEDGYLAIDARGFPYPIDAIEFGMNYQPIGDSHDGEEEASSEEESD